MPIPSPFHTRTAPLNQSQDWRGWSGYLAASLYQVSHEPEYYAIRNAAGLIDVSPLFKYEISGPDATRLLDRVMTRNVSQCAVGQVLYSPWCDDDGKVIDDGTVTRLELDHYRVTAADPNLVWFQDCSLGMNVDIRDVSEELVALAVQGPNARQILNHAFPKVGLDGLRYYRATPAGMNGTPITITRTGYTGDLGYELWAPGEGASELWDLVAKHGADYGLLPVGMVALDIARIEAGLLLIEIDYKSSRKAHIPEHRSSPYELGLGWTVDLNKSSFIGRRALVEEKRRGIQWEFVGLEVNWSSLEALFRAKDLPPMVAGRASRSALPVYKNGRQIGQATSHTFSPILKKYIALASLRTGAVSSGGKVEIEITVEYVRHKAEAVVTSLPFYNPPRKRA